MEATRIEPFPDHFGSTLDLDLVDLVVVPVGGTVLLAGDCSVSLAPTTTLYRAGATASHPTSIHDVELERPRATNRKFLSTGTAVQL